jgi:multicomponent Na+:H+ antiporter subunit B
MLELYVTTIFMLIGAVIAVELPGLLSSVVTTGVVGMGICLMFLFLRAPDLAITQLVVEILMLIVMIRATIGRGVSRIKFLGSPWAFATFTVFAVIFLGATFLMLKELPAFGQAPMRISEFYVQNSLSKTGAANIVAGIILDFRGYDTLGEATILFTSVMGVLILMRKKGRKKLDERDESDS